MVAEDVVVARTGRLLRALPAVAALAALLAACTSSELPTSTSSASSSASNSQLSSVTSSPPLGSQIVYQWGTSSDRIWMTDDQGTGGRELIDDPPGLNDYHPDWSPDGSRVVFMAEYLSHAGAAYPHSDIWVVDSDGTNARLLYESPADMPWSEYPAWSPDGSSVLIAAWDKERNIEVATRSALVAIDVTTGKGTEIAVLEGNHQMLSDPRWSPDGTAIVCTIGRFNDTDTEFTGEALAVMRRDGDHWTKPTRITAFSDFAGYPDWGGPDGRIVFGTADRSVFFFIVDNSSGRITTRTQPRRNLYTILPDGSDRRDVTAGTAVADYAGQPTWMPDGRIIFTRGITQAGGVPTAAVIQPDGTGLQILDSGVTHPRVPPQR